MRAGATGGSDQRAQPFRMEHRQHQPGIGAHGETNDVCACDLQSVEHGNGVGGGDVVAIGGRVVGNVGGRIAARRHDDTAVGPGKMRYLRRPAAVVAGELVEEQDRMAGAPLLDVELRAVLCSDMRHGRAPLSLP
jgi:hypothetical protein